MKRFVVLVALSIVVTGFATAGGLVFHVGAGYHSSFVGELPENLENLDLEITSMPLGLGGYAGIGYGFGNGKKLSLGVEFAPSWDFNIKKGLVLSSLNYQTRGFVKLAPLDMLTVTGFVGYAGDILISSDINNLKSNGNATLGARLTAFFLYAEYGMVTPWDFSEIYKHEIGLGFAIFK